MGEGRLHMEYQFTNCDLVLNSVFSGGQLDLGEHSGSSETEHGQQQGPDTEVSFYWANSCQLALKQSWINDVLHIWRLIFIVKKEKCVALGRIRKEAML